MTTYKIIATCAKTQMAIDGISVLGSFDSSRLVFLHWGFREDYPECQSHYQSEASEDIPAGLPALPDSHWTLCNHWLGIHKVVHNCLRIRSSWFLKKLTPILKRLTHVLIWLTLFLKNNLCLYTIYFTPNTIKITPIVIFILSYQKKVVYLHPQFHAGDVCTSSAGVADIFKRRLLTLCSDP